MLAAGSPPWTDAAASEKTSPGVSQAAIIAATRKLPAGTALNEPAIRKTLQYGPYQSVWLSSAVCWHASSVVYKSCLDAACKSLAFTSWASKKQGGHVLDIAEQQGRALHMLLA